MPDFTGRPAPDLFTFAGLDGGETFDGLGGQDTIDGAALFNNYLYDLDSGTLSLTDGSLPATLLNFEVVLAGNGDDRLISGTGTALNELDGGVGNDTLSPGSAGLRTGDVFAGGAGTNTLDFSGLRTDAVIDMNSGAFTLQGASATISNIQQIIAGSGHDFIRELSGFGSVLRGGLGNDTLATAPSGITGDEVFDGGAGTDLLDMSNINGGYIANLDTGTLSTADGAFSTSLVGIEQIEGGGGNDTLIAGSEARVYVTLRGNAGNDSIVGGLSNDLLQGGTGNDVIEGNDGADRLLGDAGFDLLIGGNGNDRLEGGAQADNLLGNAGDDVLIGGQGFDRLFGGTGHDRGFGGTENDALFGQNGNDTLNGQDGNDRIFGGFNNDLLGGDNGNDRLFGGAGFDTLIGGTGDDVLSGNFNADSFLFADFGGGFGQDTITDFAATNDFETIDLSRVRAITNLFDLFSTHMEQVGQNVVIDAGAGNTITLLNVDLGDLDRADFIF